MKKENIRKNLPIIIFVIVALIFLLIFSLLYVQEGIFFTPWHDSKSYNALSQTENFEELNITNENKKISGWIRYNVTEKPAPLLIYFGGNQQNSSNAFLNFFKTDSYKYFDGYNMIMADYPGYGLSDGKPSDKTMFESALKVYDYACNLDYVDKNNIVILGYSIGTGVATYVASQRNVNGLMLIAPYDEALSLYNNAINIFHGPLKALAKYKFDSLHYSQSVTVSPLIITSYDDEVINYKFSLNLANHFKNTYKTVVLNNNVKHNDYFSQESVLEDICNYLQSKL